jgi:hypothetical protein
MENLFVTHLAVNGQSTEFAVRFEEETYIFQPAGAGIAEIRIKREGETWVAEGPEGELSKMAIAKLEAFLLAQH